MKKSGFTLIELLAVIVVLAIVALIATPMIMDVIEKAKKGAAIDSVYGILESGEKYYTQQLMHQEEIETTFNLTEDTLKYKGSKPESGTLIIGEKGKMYIIAKYGAYCVEKKFEEEKPEIVEKEDCKEESLIPDYIEPLLNGADPVLATNAKVRMRSDSINENRVLIPVTIEDDGTVRKANLKKDWYKYEEKRWANAVILKDEHINYEDEQVIKEENIESYFVWIPKYSYQLWDMGNYTGITSINSSKVHSIAIRFGIENTSDEVEGECTTPMRADGTQGLAGESGNCQLGDYMTHPSFLAFSSNGFWVGKFETGYEGASTSKEAEVNEADATKVIIKPNVYSWRNITVGNAFQTGYEYKRNLESHMMKNTEWGAVAYLSHSIYGNTTRIRVNNNGSYITGYASTEEPTKGYNKGVSIAGNRVESTALAAEGTYTKPYNTNVGIQASTTGNITGVYDMAGGAHEEVMAYTSTSVGSGGSSGITSIYSDFLSNSNWYPYYDKYTANGIYRYNNRILGDAIGEMGSFYTESDPDGVKTRARTSWYQNYSSFMEADNNWVCRGRYWNDGTGTGAFATGYTSGSTYDSVSFRIVLTP